MRNQGPSAWAGYGDTGYVARPRTSRKAARAKSKAFQAYGATYGGKPKKQASKGTKKRYAALDTGAMIDTAPAKSLTGGGVRWVASASCLNGTLRSVVAQVASYGSVTVNSTCRSKSHNAKVGGASKSHHPRVTRSTSAFAATSARFTPSCAATVRSAASSTTAAACSTSTPARAAW